MLAEIVSYYWPRLIFGAWVSFTMTMTLRGRYSKGKKFLYFLVMLATSCTVVSIVTELLADYFYNSFIFQATSGLSEDAVTAVHVFYLLFCNIISYVIPIYIFAKIIKEHWTVAAGVYLIYVVFDKAAMILSINTVTYLLTIVLLLAGAFFVSKDEMDYVMNHAKTVEWKPVLQYLVGLFLLLEAVYGSYYIFPGLLNGEFNLRKAWTDLITVIAIIFFAGYCRMNLKASKEQAAKLQYLEELKESQRDIIQKFSEISEAKSGETGQHVKRVAEYSAVLAKEYGLNEDEIECIKIASMMHDVGKLLVPREIIEKPGALTDEEREIMREHTIFGKDILSNSKGEVIKMASVIASEHHERWDGTGYPNGISGDEISTYAQIVAIADVYDALTSVRAYKDAWNPQSARDEIISQSGKQFAPALVYVFEKCFDKFKEIQQQYAD